MNYEQPQIQDFGDLRELTEATLFFGTEDARAKVDPTIPVAHFS